MNAPLLVLERLAKTFKRRWGWRRAPDLAAVRDLSLEINRGDLFGFLGPNGAGKSTTLRMALGLIHPSAGRVLIDGRDLARERLAALRKVGAFVEAPSFYGYLSGRKNLELFASLSGKIEHGEIDRVLERVGLLGRERDPVEVYSHGMRQRLGLAACLLPRPELLILDEPTDGLDPHGIRDVRALLRSLVRDDGLTVFLSSHLLSEVENLCNRVAFLDQGVCVAQGELAELARRHRRLTVRVDLPDQAALVIKAKLGLDADLLLSPEEGLCLAPGVAPEAVNRVLLDAGFPVRALEPEADWLARFFLEHTTSREIEGAAA
ncbi:MAG: ABC transporter ATP-binding protein [Planctomycetota bacterium]|nr:ABC transporter ATP-binding protein [Planctomycetota bacterium]